MADSWEDHADDGNTQEQIVYKPQQPKMGGLNPNASAFSFNPTASSFVPDFAPAAQPPPPPAAPAPPPPAPPTPAPVPAAAPPEQAARDVGPPPQAVPAAADQISGDVGSLSIKEAPAEQAAAAPAPAPVAEEEEEVEEVGEEERRKVVEKLRAEDPREHLNIVFIGHVDAGKSTLGGQILYLTGSVDDRTIEKYEREAKDKNRESWYMAYIMDTNEEERAKGKTVEVGRANFATDKKRYTILDAPGHKNYVPNMISGATQADLGVLVIAARKGEFETGFERGGQTREHAQLAKTLGVQKLVVVVNKMDDPSIIGADGKWSQARYEEIEKRLSPFLKSCGFKPQKDVVFLPISGLHGYNIKDPVAKDMCTWYSGPSLFQVFDGLEPGARDPMAAFRMPVIDRFKDMGTVVMGKSEAGYVQTGTKLLLMPNRDRVTVVNVYRDDEEVEVAGPGENLKIRLQGAEEESVSQGFVLCSPWEPVPVCRKFEVQLQVLELLEHKAIFTAGYKCILHIHALTEECECSALIAEVDVRTGAKKKVKFVKSNSVVVVRLETEKAICVETFAKVPQLGRFTLRDEGRTIAIGKVTKLPPAAKAQ